MKKKFTLIELLVVVAIIGILASLLLPVLGKARERSREAVCISNLKQQGTAMFMYQDDNEGEFVERNGASSGGSGFHGWRWPLAQYLQDTSGQTMNQTTLSDAYHCPIYEFTTNQKTGHAYNIRQLGGYFNTIGNIRDLDVPSETQVIADGTDTDTYVDKFTLPVGLFGSDTSVGDRHRGGINNLWADGSVSYKRKVAMLAGKEGLPYYYWVREKQ